MDGDPGSGSWTPVEHTADIGIDITAPSFEELLRTAARALFDLMVDLDTIRPTAPYLVRARGGDTEELLVRWLSELLYLRDTQDLLFCRFDLQDVEPVGLTCVAWGEHFDPSRHAAKTGIKAVTYHQVTAVRTPEGWRARVIFDV